MCLEAQRTLEVMGEFQRRGLTFEKHLQVFREHGMPWMAVLLRRLPEKLKGQTLLNVLTFVSAVGAIQHGAYVDYVRLVEVLNEMSKGGISQWDLQKLRILGNLKLEKVKNAMVLCLHRDLPHKLVSLAVTIPSLRPPPTETAGAEQPEEDVQAVEEQDDIRPAVSKTRGNSEPC